MQRALVRGTAGNDDRLQRRRGEVVAILARPAFADRVPDPDLSETPELPDLPRGDRLALDVRAALEDADRGDLLLMSRPNRSRSRTRTVPENMRT